MGFPSLCLIAILLSVCAGSVFGCSCFPTHPQQQFCKSDFVIKAFVKGSFIQGRTRVYIVKVIAVYKCIDGVYIERGSELYIKTAVSGAACGVFLTKGKYYVLAGSYDLYRGFNINSCNFLNKLCTDFTPCQLDHLVSGRYKNNCACEVTTCFTGSPCPKPTCGCVNTIGTNQDAVCMKYTYRQICFWQGC